MQEVLDLDPAEKVARALWENLQRQLRLRTLQPRIDALLKKGHEQMAQRLFEEACKARSGPAAGSGQSASSKAKSTGPGSPGARP